MKKLWLYILACLSLSPLANAENPKNELMAQTLSLSYGAPVEVKIDAQNCQINYPEIIVKEEKNEPVETAPGEQSYVTKTLTTPIAKTDLSCVKTTDFAGMAQYKITNTSPNRLLAQIYNAVELPFVKDLKIGTFNEEMQIVPQIGMVSANNISIADVSYTETDQTTGLKKEIGNLKDLKLKSSVSSQDNTLKYLTDTQFNGFNLALPMFSLQIGSLHQATEAVRAFDPQNPAIDYTNLLNLLDIKSSRSRAVIKDIKLGSDLFGTQVNFNLEAKNHALLQENEQLESSGTLTLNNIQITGDLIEKNKQPRTIIVSATVNGLQLAPLAKLVELQQKMQQQDLEAEVDDQEVAKAMEQILETAKFLEDMEVKFADASISAHFELSRQNSYLYGKGKLTISNLHSIFPELKECLKNANQKGCLQQSLLGDVSDYIDWTKNNSESLFIFNEKGVFLNNKKIGEPIEIDLQKLLQDDDNENNGASVDDTDALLSDDDILELDDDISLDVDDI